MLHIKKLSVAMALLILMVIGMAATRPAAAPPGDEKPKSNLKVLPKHISHEELGKIMDEWKTALGVKCSFCHAPSKDSTSHHMDWASDEKPEKNIARHMFTMTNKINKKYFKFNKDEKGELIPTVSCMTCHHGSPHPEGQKEGK